jgi:hypothetical protein
MPSLPFGHRLGGFDFSGLTTQKQKRPPEGDLFVTASAMRKSPIVSCNMADIANFAKWIFFLTRRILSSTVDYIPLAEFAAIQASVMAVSKRFRAVSSLRPMYLAMMPNERSKDRHHKICHADRSR